MTVRRPSGFIEPCQPSKATRPPSGPQWVHEIKHDGHRLMVRPDGDRVRCFTRGGYDWTDRSCGLLFCPGHRLPERLLALVFDVANTFQDATSFLAGATFF